MSQICTSCNTKNSDSATQCGTCKKPLPQNDSDPDDGSGGVIDDIVDIASGVVSAVVGLFDADD
jgi:hypothetical protein